MASRTVGDFPVSGKIVCITGGGSGIGLALAKLAHSRGARVLIGDLKLTPEAESLVSSSPNEIKFQKCDVTSFSDLRNLITASVKLFGEVPDVVAPVAGIFEPPWSNFWDDQEEQGYKTMDINVNHPIKLTRLAMKALLGANKKGVVCLVASGAGLAGFYLTSLYCASKHAIVGFTKSMGQADQDEGVKIVCICPGIVASPLWTDRIDDRAKAFNYGTAPMLGPEEVAETMMNMIEEGKYGGGTVLARSSGIEEVVFDQASSQIQNNVNVPPPDMSYIKGLLDSERGKPWKA